MADNIDEWLEQALKELAAKQTLKVLRERHPYLLDLMMVLKPHPGGLARRIVLHTLERNRNLDGLPIPRKFEEAVQSVYNRYCVDSSVFKRRKAPLSDGLFYSPGGKGSGKWAVHPERSTAWLKAELPG